MGRWYTGDIEGKFWFALQSSTAASRFGGEETEPSYINYYFDQIHLEDVNDEIKAIEDKLGDNLQKIKDFFEKNNGYNDSILEENGILEDDLSDYADLLLGIQIRDCIIKNGSCSFEAEL
jgi:hypothetical protein